MKYLAYYENYLKSLAQELKLPIYDANGDNFINIKDYENILSVYFHGKIPENWKCINCTNCKYCINCKNCKWCTGCMNCTACTKCTGSHNGFVLMFNITGAKSNNTYKDIIIRPHKQTFMQKLLTPFMNLLYPLN